MKSDLLYNLLPAIYRELDAENGFPLRSMVDVLQGQFDLLHDDIGGLYNDWFIETCRPWVIPYLADLLNDWSAPPLGNQSRRFVANCLGYRRRKGTPATLENVVFDVTGWRASVVETFRAVGQTANLAHLRPGTARTACLRRPEADAPGGAFATAAHTVDFHLPAVEAGAATPGSRGRFNLGCVALYIWRLPVSPVQAGLPYAVDAAKGRWTFHPLGVEIPLIQRRSIPTDRWRTGCPPPLWLTRHSDAKLLPRIWRAGAPAREIACRPCDLSEWKTPAVRGEVAGEPEEFVAVDPRLGRFLVSPGLRDATHDWRVDFAFAGNTTLGGGPYPRAAAPPLPGPEPWRARIRPVPVRPLPREITAALASRPHSLEWGQRRSGGAEATEQTFSSFEDALRAWQETGRPGHIFLPENFEFAPEKSLSIDFHRGTGAPLTIEAGGGVCATFRGPWKVASHETSARLRLIGLWLEGPLELHGDIALELSHCTLLPRRQPSISAVPGKGSEKAQLSLSHCISGALSLPGAVGSVAIESSIIDGLGGAAIDLLPHRHTGSVATAPVISLRDTTVFGSVAAAEARDTSDSIITGPLHLQRAASPAIRHSYFPPGSDASGQHSCAFTPTFTTRRFGRPGYARLGLHCPPEILGGASDGDEIGAFHGDARLARENQLRALLDEFLPLGLCAVIFYET